ncbi:MAG: hypothetical protein H6651_07550 [Ardenticatenales bacterium]|nr:hypothetical protein [Ardenticatenales bacterium]
MLRKCGDPIDLDAGYPQGLLTYLKSSLGLVGERQRLGQIAAVIVGRGQKIEGHGLGKRIPSRSATAWSNLG